MDIEEIRSLLKNYYGTAMQYQPAAVMDLSAVDYMNDEAIIREALRLGLICKLQAEDDEETE